MGSQAVRIYGAGDAAGLPLGSDPTTPLYTASVAANAASIQSAVVNQSTTGDKTIVAAVASQSVKVYRLRLNVAAANVITIKDGAGTTLEVLNFTAAGFVTYDFAAQPWYKTSAGNAFIINIGTANQVNGVVEYIQSA